MSTIKEVSKLADVSPMTVSRAINTPDTVSKKTLLKVRAAIEQLQYVPNLSAQRIRGAGSARKTIGILSLSASTTPFAVELLQAIEFFAKQLEWNTFTVNSFTNPPDKDCVVQLMSHRPDAIIICSMLLQSVSIPDEISSVPVVLANCTPLNKQAASFIPDDEHGQYQLAKNAFARGYRKPFFLSLPKQSHVYTDRHRGFYRACKEFDIKFEASYQYDLEIDDNYDEVINRLEKLLTEKTITPDVIICGNDRIALVTYQHLMTRGIKIPSDLAVLGYDNMIIIRDLFFPTLTTVELPFIEIGKRSITYLAEKTDEPYEHKIRCPIVSGNSW